MKYDTKYCYIEKNGKDYQLTLTQPYPTANFAIDQFLAHIRFLMPIGTAVSSVFFGISLLNGIIDGLSLQLALSFLAVTGIFYFPNASFPTGISCLLRNNKLKKMLKNFYDETRDLEFNKLSRKINDRTCLKEQQKLAQKLLKTLKKYQTINLKQFEKYKKKLEKSNNNLSTTQAFAYEQLESSIITIDKFIFHNFALLKELCPNYIDFLYDRVYSYERDFISKRYLTDEIVRQGLCRPNYNDTYVNDDILHRDSSYPSELCAKFSIVNKSTKKKSVSSVSTLQQQVKQINRQEEISVDEFLKTDGDENIF